MEAVKGPVRQCSPGLIYMETVVSRRVDPDPSCHIADGPPSVPNRTGSGKSTREHLANYTADDVGGVLEHPLRQLRRKTGGSPLLRFIPVLYQYEVCH